MSLCVSSGTQPEVLPELTSCQHKWNSQFGVLDLERARPKRCLRDHFPAKKMSLKNDDVRSSWNKTFKIIYYWFNLKNTLMRQHCVGQLLLFISEKQGTATTKSRSIIYLDYLVLVKKKKTKKQVDVNLLFVKLYCSSTLNYLQLNYSYSARF